MKNLALVAALVAVTSTVAISTANAAPEGKSTTAVKALKNVPAAELPAAAARVVVSAKPAERQAIAAAVVRAVAAKNPNALVSVVASIAQAAPETAAVAASTAALLLPRQAEAIALAAAKAAPSEADKIAAAVAKSIPASAVRIAEVIATSTPAASAKVFAAVGAAVPEALPRLAERTQTASSTRTTSSAADSPGQGGVITPVFGPIGSGPRTPPTATTGEVAGSDEARNYAQ